MEVFMALDKFGEHSETRLGKILIFWDLGKFGKIWEDLGNFGKLDLGKF